MQNLHLNQSEKINDQPRGSISIKSKLKTATDHCDFLLSVPEIS